MNGFLDNLVARRADPVEALRPRLLARFEPSPSASLPLLDTLIETPTEAQPDQGRNQLEATCAVQPVLSLPATPLTRASALDEQAAGSGMARLPNEWQERISRPAQLKTITTIGAPTSSAELCQRPGLPAEAPASKPTLQRAADQSGQPPPPLRPAVLAMPSAAPDQPIAPDRPLRSDDRVRPELPLPQPLQPQHSQAADLKAPSLPGQEVVGPASAPTRPDRGRNLSIAPLQEPPAVQATVTARPRIPLATFGEQAGGSEDSLSIPSISSPDHARPSPAVVQRLAPAAESHPANPASDQTEAATKKRGDGRSEATKGAAVPLPGQLTINPEWDSFLRERTQEIAARLAPHPAVQPLEVQGPTAPAIHVTIGRIEVRAMPPPAPAKPKPRPAAPMMSLDEYLRQRASGGR